MSAHLKMSDIAAKNLRKIRIQLKLRYRDVQEASKLIAKRRNNSHFIIGLSRLSEIEHRGTVPTIYRLHSLAAIYGIDFFELLQWYGVDLGLLSGDAAALNLAVTRPVYAHPPTHAQSREESVSAAPPDLTKTTFISRQAGNWGPLPVSFLKSIDAGHQSYAMVGTEDWSMYPVIAPGSFIQIDETKRRVVNSGWSDFSRRPIYMVEHRSGYRCGWCTDSGGQLIVQPHPSSQVPAAVFQIPSDAEIVGQVVAVAMRLDLEKQLRKRSSTALK
jgi:transcriptional regulator with XRE-family HTH domain